jgi:hypothetical protein
MRIEPSSGLFAYGSLACTASFWLGLMLSYFPASPQINLNGAQWLRVLGMGIAMSVVAGMVDFERRVWIFAVSVSAMTFLLAAYVVVS